MSVLDPISVDPTPHHWRVKRIWRTSLFRHAQAIRYFADSFAAETYADLQRVLHPRHVVVVEECAWRQEGLAS